MVDEKSPLETHKVDFGLFDVVSKQIVEVQSELPEMFETATQVDRKLVPREGGTNIKIDLGTGTSLGDVDREIESVYEVDKYLPVETLKEGQKPRIVTTVFGKVVKDDNRTLITHKGCSSFIRPFIFAQKGRGQILEEEKARSRFIGYIGIGVSVVSLLVGAYELFGVPSFLKEDTSW